MTQPAQSTVEFSGHRVANGPLTWGQQALWRSIEEFAPHSSWQNISRVVTVPKRRPLGAAQVIASIGVLLDRHESLRTRIVRVDGELRQVTADAGRLPVSVVVADTGTAERTAQQVHERLHGISFDYAADWPVRASVVVEDRTATHLVVVFSHLAVDFYAAEALAGELRLIMLRGDVRTPPGLQSLDLAERQHGVDARIDERARAYWLEQYGRLPGSMFPDARPAAQPWHRGALLTSRALDVAARLLAARHGVSSSTVLLAATLALIARRGGRDICGLVTMSNNRYQERHQDAVAKLNQLGLVVVDMSDRPDFEDLIHRTGTAALRAYRNSYYNPITLNSALGELAGTRDVTVEPDCYFDDIRLPGADNAPIPVATEAQVRAGRDVTTLVWTATPAKPMRAGLPLVSAGGHTWRLRLRVLDARDGVTISLEIDARYLTTEDAERFLWSFEELLVESAFAPAAVVGPVD